MENKLKFVDTVLRQSKFWSRLFDCCEAETIFLPDIKKDIHVLILNLLFTGSTDGKESEFEEFYETLLYLSHYLLFLVLAMTYDMLITVP